MPQYFSVGVMKDSGLPYICIVFLVQSGEDINSLRIMLDGIISMHEVC
jgi:hypothetical protein